MRALSFRTPIDTKTDDSNWPDRNHYWSQQVALNPARTKFRQKKPTRVPMVLTGHGVYLRVDHGALLIRNGLTHYPQVREEFRLFSGDRHNPSRIVVVDGSGGLSFEVLSWLSSQNIPLVCIDWRGKVISVTGNHGYSAAEKIVQAQRDAQKNGRWQLIVRELVAEKISNSISTLKTAFPASPAVTVAVAKLNMDLALLRRSLPSTPNGFRGIEGRVGAAYFSAWQSFPLRWKSLNRHPIPEAWKRIGQRQSLLNGKNFNASHPVNAMLNYVYGVLENQVRIAAASAGLDLTIGYLHSPSAGRDALIYDLMEPWRPRMDAKVLAFVQAHTFAPADFTLRRDGVCRLNPQLTRALIATADMPIDSEALIERFIWAK